METPNRYYALRKRFARLATPDVAFLRIADQAVRRVFISLPLWLALLGFCDWVSAADARPAPPPPPLPEQSSAPPPGRGDDGFEPDITVTSKGTEIHEEYRHNGQLYMVKVIPAKGPPYYLIYDERGNARHSDLEPDIIAPSWVIKRF
jgi:hypothetical protein